MIPHGFELAEAREDGVPYCTCGLDDVAHEADCRACARLTEKFGGHCVSAERKGTNEARWAEYEYECCSLMRHDSESALT